MGALARVEQAAQATLYHGKLGDRTATDGGEGMIEMRHALIHQTREHEHHAEGRGGFALEVGVTAAASDANRLQVATALGVQIAPTPGFPVTQPAERVSAPSALQKALGARRPPLVDRPLAEHPTTEPADRACRPSSRLGLAFGLVLRERVLICCQRGHVVALGVPQAGRSLERRPRVAVHTLHSNTAAPGVVVPIAFRLACRGPRRFRTQATGS